MGRKIVTDADMSSPDIFVSVTARTVSENYHEVTFEAHDPLSDGDPIHALIGRVAVAAARLDHLLETIIWVAMNVQHDAIGAAVTSGLAGHHGRIHALKSLAQVRHLPTAVVKQIDQLKKDADNLAGRRNRIVHDPWYGGDAHSAQQLRKGIRDPGGLGLTSVTTADIERTLTQYQEASGKAHSLHEAVRAFLRGPR